MAQQLSDAELEIMKLVWGNPAEVTRFSEIMDGLAARGRACQKNTLAVLLSRLEEDKKGGLFASPDAAYLSHKGQSFSFIPVNTTGIYAASYESSDPAVAIVDESGTVTAAGPGQAVITLHYEGDGGPQDFTCAVTCAWD